MDYLSGNLSAEEVRKTEMFKRGDCILVWVNEGEFLNLQLQNWVLEAKVAELQTLLIEQYESDKALYESPDYTVAIDYEPLLDRHDASYKAIGKYIEAMKGEKE